MIVGRNGCKVKGGMWSVIVLTEWGFDAEDVYKPSCVTAMVVDGKNIKPDVWYTLKDGKVIEANNDEE